MEFKDSAENINVENQQEPADKNNVVLNKTIASILFSAFCNPFSIAVLAIAILMICFQLYVGVLFAIVFVFYICVYLFFAIKAKNTVDKSLAQSLRKAFVVRDGKTQEISEKDIAPDEIVLIERNTLLSVDGVITQGNVGLDESRITGDSATVFKSVGEKVYSGSIVVCGNALIKAEATNKEETAYRKASSKALNSLYKLSIVFGVIALAIIAFVVLTFAIQGKFASNAKVCIASITGSLVMMLPYGLYYLSSTALAVSSIKLSKNKVQIKDYYAMETLARADTLFIDKTGTITNGELSVKKAIPLKNGCSEIYITQAISNVLCATNDNNSTAKALKNYFALELSSGVISVLRFNPDNKYSGASFKGGKTFIIGAPEYMPLNNKDGVIKRCEEYTKEGYRVLILGEGIGSIENNAYNNRLEAIALIVMEECIREGVLETIDWFTEKGVDVRVISGDSELTAAAIASKAGIKNCDKYISLQGMSIDVVKSFAFNYTVFGRATPAQKQALINVFEEQGRTVAMLGDGANDIPALSSAKCAITVDDATDSTKAVSQVVLSDSCFQSLIDVVNEGTGTINAVQKIASLFVVRSIVALVLTLVFTLVSIVTNNKGVQYPLYANYVLPIDIMVFGFAAFAFAFDKNERKLKNSFLGGVFKKSIPISVVLVANTLVVFWLYHLQLNKQINVGIFNWNTMVVMSVISLTFLWLAFLYTLCTPLTKFRKIILIISCATSVSILLVLGLISYFINRPDPLLQIPFNDLGMPALLTTIIIVIALAAIYLGIYAFITIFKGDKKDEN